jgi:hypothetical protein
MERRAALGPGDREAQVTTSLPAVWSGHHPHLVEVMSKSVAEDIRREDGRHRRR